MFQKNLKKTLGGQFAQREAEEFFKRSYDPDLDESLNVDKINRALETLKAAYAANESMVEWASQNNGDMRGYTGPTVKSVLIDDKRSAEGMDTTIIRKLHKNGKMFNQYSDGSIEEIN